MIEIKQDSIVSGTSTETTPAWMVWGTADYEQSLAATYPHADRSMINSLIAVTRRIAEKERHNRVN